MKEYYDLLDRIATSLEVIRDIYKKEYDRIEKSRNSRRQKKRPTKDDIKTLPP